jgi:hypothetical protein
LVRRVPAPISRLDPAFLAASASSIDAQSSASSISALRPPHWTADFPPPLRRVDSASGRGASAWLCRWYFAVQRVLSFPQLRRKTGARSLRFAALAAASEIRAMPSKSLSLSARVMRVCVRIVVKGGLRADPTVEGARRRMKSLGRLVPRPPRGTETIAVDAGGVKADRIATPASRPDRHVLYLHGGSYVVGSPASTAI